MMIFVVPIIGVIVLVCFFVAEQKANDKRIKRGQPPVKHHDLTDMKAPIDTINWWNMP
mgnify:CR=1 FL=1